MNYTYKLIGDIYVVWFAPANRFMQLQKPAYRILEDWTQEIPETQIMRNCVVEFQLQMNEARRFVMEVTGQLQLLTNIYKLDKIVSLCDTTYPRVEFEWFSTKYYFINGICFRFRFNDLELEELIHPGFDNLENDLPASEPSHTFDLYHRDEQVLLQTDGCKTWKCPDSNPEHLVGSVFMQMMNCIHNLSDDLWIGAVHSSAVSAGKGAVLFTAPSGSGKSTFAALMMNHGFNVLTDDFSAISLNDTKVYPFPKGISIKDRYLKELQPYFPLLTKKKNSSPNDTREVFLPIATEELPAPAPVIAIVFLKYNTEVEVEFKKISNLEAMDRFLQQLWLQPTAEVASSFMDWYFHIPCYTLQYSDTKKAINSLSILFN